MFRKLRAAIKWALLVLLACFAVHLIAFEGWKDLLFGRQLRIAHAMFSQTYDYQASRIDIFLLQGEDHADTGKTFGVGTWNKKHPIHGVHTLTGDELETFIDLWSDQHASSEGSMCHDPAYGFRIYQKGRLVREAALCWSCMNFSFGLFPGIEGIGGFNAESPQAIKLLEFCDARLPYKRYDTSSADSPGPGLPFVFTEPVFWFTADSSIDPDSELTPEERDLRHFTAMAFAYHTWSADGKARKRDDVYSRVRRRILHSEFPDRFPSQVLFPDPLTEDSFIAAGGTFPWLTSKMEPSSAKHHPAIEAALRSFDEVVSAAGEFENSKPVRSRLVD